MGEATRFFAASMVVGGAGAWPLRGRRAAAAGGGSPPGVRGRSPCKAQPTRSGGAAAQRQQGAQRPRRRAGNAGGLPLLDIRTLFRQAMGIDVKNAIHVPASELEYNAKIKRFPNGSEEVLICSKAIFREDGWEASDHDVKQKRRKREKDAVSSAAAQARAMRRARAAVRDLALCNDFRYFVTLTLDRAKVDRYDMAAITRKLNCWLDNAVRRRGLAYVLVPERHQDGAIHFHGFFNDALEVVYSGHTDGQGHEIFNLPAWSLGFTTAIRLYGDYASAVGYVCKYIGKQGEKPGGRWFYSGGKLRKPDISYGLLDFREAEAEGEYTFCVPEAGLAFVLLRGGETNG